MASAHVRSRDTGASPAQVWKVWSDTTTWPRWNPDVEEITLEGPFADNVRGSMRTKSGGSHAIELHSVEPGRGFELHTAPVPLATFVFTCEIARGDGSGSRISQRVSMHGPLGWLFSMLMGERLADSFGPLLEGLARDAETTPPA